MDMLIPATVSRISTAGTESTTATGSIFGDDSTTGTPTNAHSHMITFTTMVGHVSSEDVGSVRQFLHAPMKCICWNTATQKGELPVLITFQVQMIRQETASFWKHTLQREVAILSPCQHGLKMLRQRWTETWSFLRIPFLRQARILAFPHPSLDELKICSLPKVLTLVTMPLWGVISAKTFP